MIDKLELIASASYTKVDMGCPPRPNCSAYMFQSPCAHKKTTSLRILLIDRYLADYIGLETIIEVTDCLKKSIQDCIDHIEVS